LSLTTDSGATFDLDGAWRLSDQVSVRDEPFGALAYHHVNRRLVFLKSRALVRVVKELGSYQSARLALEATTPSDQWAPLTGALVSLARGEFIRAD
jgi:mycofactocin biosynthesis protein MftB